MLFLREEDIKDFDKTIGEWYDKNPIVALFLAVASFEWAARRVLLSVVSKSTLEVRKEFGLALDIDKYSELWSNAVDLYSIDDIFDEDGYNWEDIASAYKFAQVLKVEVSNTDHNTRRIVDVLFHAVRKFFEFSETHNIDLNKEIIH